jgi:hypothetical protein
MANANFSLDSDLLHRQYLDHDSAMFLIHGSIQLLVRVFFSALRPRASSALREPLTRKRSKAGGGGNSTPAFPFFAAEGRGNESSGLFRFSRGETE